MVSVVDETPAAATRPFWESPPGVAARLAWVGAELIAVIVLGEKGVLFFYQGF